MEADLENLKEKFGPLPSSSGSEDEENTPEIGADICIEELLGRLKHNKCYLISFVAYYCLEIVSLLLYFMFLPENMHQHIHYCEQLCVLSFQQIE